jgi:hypothetical protein
VAALAAGRELSTLAIVNPTESSQQIDVALKLDQPGVPENGALQR